MSTLIPVPKIKQAVGAYYAYDVEGQLAYIYIRERHADLNMPYSTRNHNYRIVFSLNRKFDLNHGQNI